MTSENVGMTMPVAPYYGGGYGGGDMFGGMNGWWGLIILLALMGYGNGFGGFGGFGGNGSGFVDANVQRGFDQQSVMSGINGVQNAVTAGFGNVQTALCSGFAGVNQGVASGFAGVNQAVANGFAQAEIAANSRQMADMNQTFALQSALQNCCCENRAATADLKYTVATEACADRNAVSNALRDVLAANAAGTQRIIDQLCSDKIDAKNEKIAELQNQLTMAQLAASQNAQTAAILANNEAQTSALEQYLAPVPRPAYVVQNPNCCGQFGFGGCGGYAA